MSQEELGQALLVSRQTISLWETGQTLPTIDNLIRLKEVFGMTLDGILCPEEKEAEANETYDFSGGDEFNREIAALTAKKQLLKSMNIIIIFALIAAVSLIFFGAGFINGIAVGVVSSAVVGLCKYRVESFKAMKKLDRDTKSAFKYLVYDNCLVIESRQNGESIHTVKVPFAEIPTIYDLGEKLAIEVDGRLYPLEKSHVAKDSKLYGIKRLDSSMLPSAFSEKLRKTVSLYLTVLSFASIFLALATIVMMSSKSGSFSSHTWIFFAFTPFPLALAVYGIILKAKKQGGIFGIVLGFFLLAVLCFYGSFAFIF